MRPLNFEVNEPKLVSEQAQIILSRFKNHWKTKTVPLVKPSDLEKFFHLCEERFWEVFGQASVLAAGGFAKDYHLCLQQQRPAKGFKYYKAVEGKSHQDQIDSGSNIYIYQEGSRLCYQLTTPGPEEYKLRLLSQRSAGAPRNAERGTIYVDGPFDAEKTPNQLRYEIHSYGFEKPIRGEVDLEIPVGNITPEFLATHAELILQVFNRTHALARPVSGVLSIPEKLHTFLKKGPLVDAELQNNKATFLKQLAEVGVIPFRTLAELRQTFSDQEIINIDNSYFQCVFDLKILKTIGARLHDPRYGLRFEDGWLSKVIGLCVLDTGRNGYYRPLGYGSRPYTLNQVLALPFEWVHELWLGAPYEMASNVGITEKHFELWHNSKHLLENPADRLGKQSEMDVTSFIGALSQLQVEALLSRVPLSVVWDDILENNRSPLVNTKTLNAWKEMCPQEQQKLKAELGGVAKRFASIMATPDVPSLQLRLGALERLCSQLVASSQGASITKANTFQSAFEKQKQAIEKLERPTEGINDSVDSKKTQPQL